MANKKRSSDKVKQNTLTHPTAFVDPATASALIPAGKFVYDVSKDALVALKPDKPLQVAIEDSVTINSEHRITAEVSNLGLHSLYLESLEITDPKGTDIRGSVLKDEAVKFGSRPKDEENQSEAFPPRRLNTNEGVRLTFVIKSLSEDRLKSKPFVTLAFTFTVLGIAKKPKKHKFYVAIR